MPEKFNPNSFAPFLESVKRAGPTTSAGPSPFRILRFLMEAPQKELDIPSLLSAAGVPLDSFANALREFEKAGLLTKRVENNTELVTLTASGEQIASVQP